MKPERDPLYLEFVRNLDCSRCDKPHCSEASHSGPRGLGQKTSDYFTAPLCFDCHAKFDGRAGESYWGMSKEDGKQAHMLLNIDTMLRYIAIHEWSHFKRARRIVTVGGDNFFDIANALKEIIKATRKRQ